MKQTKKHSFMESVVNVAVGYGVAVASQIVIFPLFNIRIPLSDNFMIGLWFTGISIVRSYTLRRIFTGMRVKA
jgi:hypothetical protein